MLEQLLKRQNDEVWLRSEQWILNRILKNTPINPNEIRKRGGMDTENRWNKWKTKSKMIDLNPAKFINTLYSNGLNIPVKKRLPDNLKIKVEWYAVYKKSPLNIKAQIVENFKKMEKHIPCSQ